MRNNPMLAALFCFVVGEPGLAGSLEYVRNTYPPSNTPWDDVLAFPQFSLPFSRLDSVGWFSQAYVGARASVSNPGTSTIHPILSANTTVSVDRPNGSDLVNLTVYLSDGTSVDSGDTETLSDSDNSLPASGVFSAAELTQFIGSGNLFFPISAAAGTISVSEGDVDNERIEAFGGLRLTYNYTPIGLTEVDPILPTGVLPDGFRFDGVPSGRWFDPVAADGFRYDMISAGDTFATILGFPTGFGSPFSVSVNGSDLGEFSPGEQVAFAPGVRSFTVYGLSPDADPTNPRAFPLQLEFNRDGVTFTMTPVPEPSTFFFLGLFSITLARSRGKQAALKQHYSSDRLS